MQVCIMSVDVNLLFELTVLLEMIKKKGWCFLLEKHSQLKRLMLSACFVLKVHCICSQLPFG